MFLPTVVSTYVAFMFPFNTCHGDNFGRKRVFGVQINSFWDYNHKFCLLHFEQVYNTCRHRWIFIVSGEWHCVYPHQQSK